MTIDKTRPKVARHIVRKIGVESYTDDRTVAGYFLGRKLRAMTLARIEMALQRLGLDELVRPKPAV